MFFLFAVGTRATRAVSQVPILLTPITRERAAALNIHFGKPSRFSFMSQPNDKMASFRIMKREVKKWSWKNSTDPDPLNFMYVPVRLQPQFPNAARRGLYLHFFKHLAYEWLFLAESNCFAAATRRVISDFCASLVRPGTANAVWTGSEQVQNPPKN
jgi:hypothetical protein